MGSRWAGRGKWFVLFVLLLGAVAAAPVLADPPADPPPAPSGISDLPDAEDVAEGVAQLKRKEAEEQAERETPAAVEERAESQQAFSDLSADAALQLFSSQFSAQLETLNSDPARFLTDARLVRPLGSGSAVISQEGTPELLEAGIPIESTNEEGVAAKVDLSIIEAGGEEGYELANPLTEVSLPETAGERIEVGESGLAISQVGASETSTAQPLGDKNLFYASAQTDTDLLVSPVSRGVELSDQLRSAESPEALRFQIDLPATAELKANLSGGAEVVDGARRLAQVPPPNAVDAQGATVPVETSVEGNELIVNVSHRSEEFAYPIDVDPSLVEDWYNASWYSGYNLQALGDGSWGWNPNTNWIYGSTSCIWTCWGSGRGLYVSAESGSHGAWQQGQWAYGPPGSTSFITSALIAPFNRNNYANCPASQYAQPHDYDGLWSESNGWIPLETNRANNYGNANPSGYGKALIIGLGNDGAGSSDKCRRDIVAGGVAIWIGDPEPPSWTSMPSAPDQWTDTTVLPVSAGAYDPGLGMKYFNLWTTNPSTGQNEALVGNVVHPCSGLHASPCPSSWSAQITNYNPASLPNGINKMNTVAYDALGIEHNSAAGPMYIKVDHLKPEISYSGELLAEHPVKYHLNVTGTDGNSGALATAQSGMKQLRFYVDGQLAGREPETASPPECVNVQEGRNVGSCQFVNVGLNLNRSLVGKHTLKIVAVDSLNHESEKSIEVNLPADTTAPTLTPSGALYNAANGWVNAGETSVSVSAQDAETGVVEEALYIDNKLVGTPATQECFEGGCSMSHTFTPSLASYTEGAHTVKLIAKDGAGKVGETSWTVKVDSAIPTMTSISAPEVPSGWTPQLTSFNLSYKAADTGSGVKKIEVTRPGVGGTTIKSTPYNSACTGTAASPCPASTEGTTAISTTNMAQGEDTVTVKAYDAFSHVSSSKTVTVRVDREGPAVVPSGPLMTGGSSSLIGLVTKLTLNVKDKGAGVESVELQLDGEPVELISLEELLNGGGSQSCSGEICELNYNFAPVVGEAKAPGPHTAKLVVRDKASHATTISHEVTIDTRPPELNLSGPLAEAAGEPLPEQVENLIAEAKDGEGPYAAGLANLKIEVDGQEVFFEPSTATGGTPQEHMWIVDENNHRIQEFNEKGEFVNAFGSTGSQNGQFARPTAIALDPKGSLWVTDAGNNRIEEFTENGQFRRAIGSYGTGNGQFSGPEGITVDVSGNVWVADTYNARIQEFDEKGKFLKAFGTRGSGNGQLVEPTSIAVGPAGNVWVTDWGNNKVVEFKPNGELIRQFGSLGTGPGQFKQPDAILIDSEGNVWVGDQNNERIQEFNQSGQFAAQFGSAGSGAGQFNFGYPMGIGVDSKGALWVSDTGNNRLQKWSAGNYSPASIPTYISSFGSSGTGNGQFAHPGGDAVDAKGNLWVADENNKRVEKFNEKGEYLSSFGSAGSGNGQFSRPTDVAVDPKGNLWVSDAGNNRIEEFNEKGEFLKAIGTYGTGNLQFSAPESLTVDAKGNVWVGDTYNHRVQELNEKGEFVRVFGTYGTGTGQIVESTGIAVDAAGNVWVADWGNNKVLEFTETGTFVRQFGTSGTANGQFKQPDVIEIDAKGDVWVGDQNNERIQEFNLSGEYLGQFGTAGTGNGQFNFGYPMGIAADPQGRLWISDTGNNRIQKWQIPNWGPTYISSFGSSGTGNGQFAHPGGDAVDAKGNLWVADENNKRVEKFNEKGEYLSSFGSAGSGNGQFSRPTDVAVDPKGNLWVSDAGNNRIEEFNEKGEFLKAIGTYGTGNLQFSAPESLTVDAKGNVWVGDTYNHRVQELNEKGEFVRVFGTYGTGTGQIVESTGIAVDAAGNVWVADWGNNKVLEFTETGTFVRQFGTSGTANGQFKQPDVIEIDAKGDVWVGDQNNERIQEFNLSGEYLGQFGTAGTGNGQFNFGYPMGIAADPQGRLWISDTGNNRIQKWQIPNWGPTYISSFGSSGTGNGQFAHPAGIALGMTHGCVPPGCPLAQGATYAYDEAVWGTGPHEVVVTATDATGNPDTEELHVNEPLNVVAPSCPTATPQALPAGTVVTPAIAASTLASTLPSAVEASVPIPGEGEEEATEGDPAIVPAVTRNSEEVSLDEKGIDVVGSTMGGGIEDQAAGAFTVGQATCLQPLQEGAAASEPIVTEDSAVVFANALPDTDTLVRPTALGTTVVENLRGPQAPTEFKWAVKVGSGEELVELPGGGIAIVDPSGLDLSEESYPAEPEGGWSVEELNDVKAQVEQAERELAIANNEIEGEVTAVIAPPEVVMESGEVVPGLLRITPGQVVVAQLPPGTFAEAEALIIKANPAAEPESICASVLASAPQYYPEVCGREHEPASSPPDPSETLVPRQAIAGMEEPSRGRLLNGLNAFAARYGIETPGFVETVEGMTDEERAVCAADLLRCKGFYYASLKATEIEDKAFTAPPGSQNTKGNAFKHAFWTLEMEVENNFDQSGLLFAQAHEGKAYTDTEHPAIRKESEMDMMSDWVGEFDGNQKPKQKLTACNDILSKMGDAIFIGRDVYPMRWGLVHDWERYRPIFRMWVDWRSGAAETVVVRNGRTCPELW
jgi:sugar lactone lactonase YvrE